MLVLVAPMTLFAQTGGTITKSVQQETKYRTYAEYEVYSYSVNTVFTCIKFYENSSIPTKDEILKDLNECVDAIVGVWCDENIDVVTQDVINDALKDLGYVITPQK